MKRNLECTVYRSYRHKCGISNFCGTEKYRTSTEYRLKLKQEMLWVRFSISLPVQLGLGLVSNAFKKLTITIKTVYDI